MSCKHPNSTASYTHITCTECGSIKTDHDGSWKIAKDRWFQDTLSFIETMAGYQND